jgi:hypothetical protein
MIITQKLFTTECRSFNPLMDERALKSSLREFGALTRAFSRFSIAVSTKK